MIFLLILAFLVIWIVVGNNEREPNWRMALVQTAIIWAGYLIVGTEILGWFGAIHKVPLSVMWSLPILGGILWGWLWLRAKKILRLPVVYHRDTWVGTILDLFVIIILAVTLIVALVSPPNSSNALVSGMSRVAHWAQNEGLTHYPTGVETQNSHSPGAEIIQLNFYVLAGNDKTANLVAWIAFAGSVAAAASLAEVFGAKVNGQRMAAIFAATIPVAITHATGAMNDIVVSFWIVSAVLMLLYYTRKAQKPFNLVLAALAAALAIATKATAFLFLWPFALFMVVILRQRLGMVKMLMWAMIALAIMGAVNGGHYLRNHRTYGQFYRPVELANQTNEGRNWRVMVSNITRNASLHADLPFPRAETWLAENIIRLHDLLDLPVNDPRTTLGGKFYIPEVNTSEQTSGNPLHGAVILISFIAVIGMVVLGKEDPDILVYTGAIFFSMVLFCYLLKWQPSNGRLHLPYFVMFAPIVGVFLEKFEKFQLETAIAAVLLMYTLPWLFQTQERPVVPDLNRTYPVSVFNEERDRLYFTPNPEAYPVYRAITDEILSAGITRIGLNLTSESLEYPFWALLGAPNEALRIEWIETETASKTLIDPEFDPEAIICEACGSDTIHIYAEEYSRITYPGFDLFIKE